MHACMRGERGQYYCDAGDPHLRSSYLQVELDHARLAMLAVLLTGAVGAGAGVPSDASFMDAQHGFAAVSAAFFSCGDVISRDSLPLATIFATKYRNPTSLTSNHI